MYLFIVKINKPSHSLLHPNGMKGEWNRRTLFLNMKF